MNQLHDRPGAAGSQTLEDRKHKRAPWTPPALRRISAASAEVGPAVVTGDGAFTTS